MKHNMGGKPNFVIREGKGHASKMMMMMMMCRLAHLMFLKEPIFRPLDFFHLQRLSPGSYFDLCKFLDYHTSSAKSLISYPNTKRCVNILRQFFNH